MAEMTPVPRTADPARLNRALDAVALTIRQRLDGLLQGNHLGLVPGPGSELGDARAYVPGDDVRRIDWAITARTTEAHVRQTIADRELETWLAVDLSASMDFGTVNCEKRDLAVVAAAIVAHLTEGGGNRIGAVIASSAGIARIPARGGRAAARELVGRIATVPRGGEGGRGDLAAALEQLRRPPRRAGLVVAISDFLGPTGWARPLRALALRHDVIAVDISDPRDLALPDVGDVTVIDPESGCSREVAVTAALRDRFAAASGAHRAEVVRLLRQAGVPQLCLSTDRDWVTDVLRFVTARKRGWDGAQGAGRGAPNLAGVGAR